MDEVQAFGTIAYQYGYIVDYERGLYSTCVQSSVWHGSETGPVKKENEVILQQAEIGMVRWMCDVKVKDRVPR